MEALSAVNHLFNFTAPAWALAALLPWLARIATPRGGVRLPYWRQFGVLAVAGLACLAAGLWFCGRDGKMATYAALVLVAATVQWLQQRAWRP